MGAALTIDASTRDVARATFRSITLVFWGFVGAAVIYLGIAVGLAQSGWSAGELDDTTGPLLAAVLAMVAVGQIAMLPWLRRRVLANATTVTGTLPAPVAALQNETIISLAFVESIGIYGLVIAIVWDGTAGIPFCVSAIPLLFLVRPRWERWDQHLLRTSPGRGGRDGQRSR